MALICREVVEQIEETVWEPVEEWVERREKKCKKKKCKKWCLCCNKWFCWIADCSTLMGLHDGPERARLGTTL